MKDEEHLKQCHLCDIREFEERRWRWLFYVMTAGLFACLIIMTYHKNYEDQPILDEAKQLRIENEVLKGAFCGK